LILRSAMEFAEVSCGPDDYVIPNRRPASVRRAERSNKVIWETVRTVGERVGVRATTHALRRAFAVAFLTSHPGAIESLQALLNHSRIDTTQVYLRALNRSKAMEPVRDLSWGLGFEAEAEEAHTGFEPVLREDDDDLSLGREPPRPASELPADLQRIVERLKKRRGAHDPRA
jgi:hypothetical protein